MLLASIDWRLLNPQPLPPRYLFFRYLYLR